MTATRIRRRSVYGLPRDLRPQLALKPRVYQSEAIVAWLRHDGRGVVVLPTGAGKTVVALMAIERLAVRTLVVVPTIELLTQWRAAIIERLGLPEERVGDRRRRAAPDAATSP